MKIAYLASKYPAVSHTFIQREIHEVEALGVAIERYSVRPANSADALGEEAASEGARTRSLLTFAPATMSAAAIWLLFTRPRRAFSTLVDALSAPGGTVQRLRWFAYYTEAVMLAWLIMRVGSEHLHVHFGNAGSNVAWLAARLGYLPFSVTFHGIDLDQPETFRHREKIRDAAFVVCISDAGRRQLQLSAPDGSDGKIHVVRCGYTMPAAEEIAPCPNRNRLLCVARLSPEKGHEFLLDALDGLKRRGVYFHCTLVGDGPLEAQIRGRIAELGLQEHVTMTGALPPSAVFDQIRQSDVFVLASLGEGIPVALMEAMARQRPVIATSVGGIPELVRDGVEGRLVSPGDAAALSDAVADVLADSGLAARMGEAGRKTVATMHDPKASARRMYDLFSRSVSQARVRS